MKLSQILTHTAVPLQHPPGLAGAFETSKCVQTDSVLADSLHGALVDVCHVRVISCFRWQYFKSQLQFIPVANLYYLDSECC